MELNLVSKRRKSESFKLKCHDQNYKWLFLIFKVVYKIIFFNELIRFELILFSLWVSIFLLKSCCFFPFFFHRTEDAFKSNIVRKYFVISNKRKLKSTRYSFRYLHSLFFNIIIFFVEVVNKWFLSILRFSFFFFTGINSILYLL